MTVVSVTIRKLHNTLNVTNNDHVEHFSTKQTQSVEHTNTSLCVTCMHPGGNTESMYSYFGNTHIKIWRRTSVYR